MTTQEMYDLIAGPLKLLPTRPRWDGDARHAKGWRYRWTVTVEEATDSYEPVVSVQRELLRPVTGQI